MSIYRYEKFELWLDLLGYNARLLLFFNLILLEKSQQNN